MEVWNNPEGVWLCGSMMKVTWPVCCICPNGPRMSCVLNSQLTHDVLISRKKNGGEKAKNKYINKEKLENLW